MNRKKKYGIFAIVILCLTILFAILATGDTFSLQKISYYVFQHPLLAAIVFLLLYAAKSFTVVFPILVLQIAVGNIFPIPSALVINLAGILIVLTIPYTIGKHVGMETVSKLIQKYPRFAKIIDVQQKNSLFLCFFLRIISCLPGDVVSMYFGATNTPLWQNLLGGTLGILPGMVLATFMGDSIQNPSSPEFWVSAILTVVLALTSLLLYYLYCKKLRNSRHQA